MRRPVCHRHDTTPGSGVRGSAQPARRASTSAADTGEPTQGPRPEPVPYGPAVATVDELGAHLTGREVASPDGVVYAVAGDVDIGATGALEDRLLAIGAAHGYVVRLDMADVEIIDSSGLRCLTKVFGELASFGGELRVVNPSPAVVRVLQLVGVEDMFGLGSA